MPHTGKGVYGQYDHSRMSDALAAVQGGLSIRKVAKQFQIPRSTLSDRVTGKRPETLQFGRKPVIPLDVEKQMAEKAMNLASQGFGIGRKQLIARASTLCKQLEIQTPFKNGIPGKDWWCAFKRRNPTVTLRKTEKLATVRSRMLNSVTVGKYMLDLHQLTKLPPSSVWNMDETGISLEHQPTRVVARQGSKCVPGRVANSRENVTLLPCINAAGEKMSPFLIVKGKTPRSLRAYNMHEGPDGAVWRYQEKAWMNDALCLAWFKEIFLLQCGDERPQVLILDSHHSHETLSLLEEACANNITVMALPPHTTHYLCPLDRCVFGPPMRAYNRTCTEFMSESPNNIVNKETFPRILKAAYEAAFTRSNIVSGFEATGIYHWNPLAIPKEAFMPSDPFNKEMRELPEDQHPLQWVLRSTGSIPTSSSHDNNPSQPSTSSSSNVTSADVSAYGDTLESIKNVIGTPSSSETTTIPPVCSTSTLSVSSSQIEPFQSLTSTLVHVTASSPDHATLTLDYAGEDNEDSALGSTFDPMVSGSFESLSDLDAATILAGLVDGGTCKLDEENIVPNMLNDRPSWSSSWNEELDNIFSLPPVDQKPAKKLNARRLTSHRLLTSPVIMASKRKENQDKEVKEAKKKLKKRKDN